MIAIFSFLSCNSGENSQQIETIIEEGNNNNIITTKWIDKDEPPAKANLDILQNQSINSFEVEKPQPVNEILPQKNSSQTYFLQLGAFANENNAKRLVSKYVKENIPVFLESSTNPQKKLLIVKAGPFQDLTQAEATAMGLAESEKMTILLLKNKSVLKKFPPP